MTLLYQSWTITRELSIELFISFYRKIKSVFFHFNSNAFKCKIMQSIGVGMNRECGSLCIHKSEQN